jgi:hypothetical protein
LKEVSTDIAVKRRLKSLRSEKKEKKCHVHIAINGATIDYTEAKGIKLMFLGMLN